MLPGIVAYRGGFRVRVKCGGWTQSVDCPTYPRALMYLRDMRTAVHDYTLLVIDKEIGKQQPEKNKGETYAARYT